MLLTNVKARLFSSLFEILEYLPEVTELEDRAVSAAMPPQRTRQRMILILVTTALKNYFLHTSEPDR
jgi:hypothetical protein